MTDEQFDKLLEEIKISRELNSSEHYKINAAADESAHLAAEIDGVLHKVKSFVSVINGIKSFVFTVSFVIAMAYFITHWAEFFSAGG